MQDLDSLITKVHRKELNARCIHQLITAEKFKSLWESTPEIERKRAEMMILGNNKDEVNIWIKCHPAIELGELPIARLRERARRLRIKNYCRLVKYELVREIARIMKEKD